MCGTTYVFRAFGHATSTLNRSAFTDNFSCATLDCGGGGEVGCTFTSHDWKVLGLQSCLPADPGLDNVIAQAGSSWPVTSLTLGSVTYSETDLCTILSTPADGNGLIALAHQLIAAKLNQAKNRIINAVTASCIVDAGALIGATVIPPVGTSFQPPSATDALTTCLANYKRRRCRARLLRGARPWT
ncbi:MAG TPA: hypothetical protein VGJ55_05455 [Pyrinomonadaceae bacterium]